MNDISNDDLNLLSSKAKVNSTSTEEEVEHEKDEKKERILETISQDPNDMDII